MFTTETEARYRMEQVRERSSQIKGMYVQDAHLRLEHLQEGALPPKDTPALRNPLYARAYERYLHDGMLTNTLREGADGAGGYLVPDEFESRIVKALADKNVLRRLARVITTRHTMKIPKSLGGGHAQWVPEEGAVPEASTAFDQITLGAYKLATMIRVSDELLEDSVFDIEDFIAESFAQRLADVEEEAFLFGDGQGKPLGLVHQLDTVIATEKAGEITPEDLVNLQHSIPAKYRENAVFLMNDDTLRRLYCIKSAFDRNIWEGDLTKAEPLRLLGKPVIVCDAMPAAESGETAILFGDFGQMVIADREHRSVKRMTEVYAKQGQVGYLISQRVDAALLDKQAIAALKLQ